VKLGMLRGLDYYVISHAVSQFPAYFKLKTWIERHNPPAEPKPKVDPSPTPTPEPEKKIDDPTDKKFDHEAEEKRKEEEKKKQEEEKKKQEE